MKWLTFLGFLALYTLAMYLIFWPKIKEHNQVAQEKPYWEQPGFKTDTIKVPTIEYRDVPYPVPMPAKEVRILDTQYVKTEVVRYVPQDSLGPSITVPSYYGKYPFLVAGSFDQDEISLTLGDTLGNIRTEIFQTTYSTSKYRYTNSSMSTANKSTRPPLNSTRKTPLVRYDRTFVEYKHDFLQSGKSVGISTGVTIKDRVRLTGFGELGLNNNIPDQAGLKIGLKLF